VFGMMERPNKPERPKREWLDDVLEWCNIDIYSSYRAASAGQRTVGSNIVGAAVDTKGLYPLFHLSGLPKPEVIYYNGACAVSSLCPVDFSLPATLRLLSTTLAVPSQSPPPK